MTLMENLAAKRRRNPLRNATRLTALAAALLFQAGNGWAGDTPTVNEIVDRALSRAKQLEENRPESEFTFRVLKVSEKLDGDGSVAETEVRLLVSEPVEGGGFERLIEKDGKSLTPEEKRKQEKRFQEYLENQGQAAKKKDEEKVVFDEDLVSRYDFTLLGLKTVNDRPAYLLGYSPKSGDLPVRRRIDRALNKSEGKLWVDQQTFELARIEFELKEKVNIGWGIIGSISNLIGKVERRPVEPGLWAPAEVEIQIMGRILFSSFRQRERISYSDFQRVASEARRAPPAEAASGNQSR